MTKDELAWILIRFTGVVLLILAFTTVVGTVPTIISMFNASDSSIYGHQLSEQQLQEMNRATTKSILSGILLVVPYIGAYTVLGLYFLLGGKWVFQLVTKSGEA